MKQPPRPGRQSNNFDQGRTPGALWPAAPVPHNAMKSRMRLAAGLARWRGGIECPRRFTTCRRSGRSAPMSTPRNTRRCTRARSRTRTASGPSTAKRVDWIKPFTKVEEHLLRAGQHLDQMVRGRHAQRRLQLRRPASRQARRPDRDHLGRRRSEGRQEDHLQGAARGSLQVRQRAEGARRQEGRPRHHLHADDPGGGLRDARLRAHRRDPFGGVRRLLAGFARRPHRGLQVDRRHHRRRRPARRQARCRSRPMPMRPPTRPAASTT